MTTSNPGATNDSTNDSTGKDPTANDQTNNAAFGPFEAWQEMFKKSTEAWAQAASGFAGFTPPSPGAMPFGSFPFPPPLLHSTLPRSTLPRSTASPLAPAPAAPCLASSPSSRPSTPRACRKCGSSSFRHGRRGCVRIRPTRPFLKRFKTPSGSGRSSWSPWQPPSPSP